MYNPDPINSIVWPVIYDKHETDTVFPTNYFLITGGSTETGIFYHSSIQLVPGQLYRLTTDACRLNLTGALPEVSLYMGTDSLNNEEIYNTGPINTVGVWQTHTADYFVPCGDGNTYFAVRNDRSEFTGNDLAFDNLSLRAILPQINAEITAENCDVAILGSTNIIENVFPDSLYSFQ